MNELQLVSKTFESELVDEYSKLYFSIKNYQPSRDYRRECGSSSGYKSSRCKKIYLMRTNRKDVRCSCSDCNLETLYNELLFIEKICFNLRDSILPPYFMNIFFYSQVGQKAVQTEFMTKAKHSIASSIDCDLMDSKNIASIIYDYGCKTIMYNTSVEIFKDRGKIYTYVVDCPWLLTRLGTYSKSYTWYEWLYIKPTLIHIDYIGKFSDEERVEKENSFIKGKLIRTKEEALNYIKQTLHKDDNEDNNSDDDSDSSDDDIDNYD